MEESFSCFDYPLQDAIKTKQRGLERRMMALYSTLLTLALLVSAPWWLLRMATTQRYREGLRQRLGGVPKALIAEAAGKRVVWLHAVSVGEVLAASQLVLKLEAALGASFRVVISTTTRTGHAVAQQRFGAERVFYMPLDFRFAVAAYMRALRPEALVLMEGELWPRILQMCGEARVPVAVVNARMSDRSFARSMRVQWLWGRVMRKPALWLAQSEDDALRLVIVGVRRERVRVAGNLKYDVRSREGNPMAERIAKLLGGRKMVVAGSTLEGEEDLLFDVWPAIREAYPETVLLIAPRHPERFDAVAAMVQQRGYTLRRCSQISVEEQLGGGDVVLLDTIGDLAAVYRLATVAFVGGSLVKCGGHNPLEPAQFGVPVLMGASFENFRDIVAKMREPDAIRIVRSKAELQHSLLASFANEERSKAMGERGRILFEAQHGATERAANAVVAMMREAKR